jgi:hypothetical protein
VNGFFSTSSLYDGSNNQRMITLPPFWTDNAAGWFAHMESCFRV